MDIDINIRQELVMLLSGSSNGQQQQVQQKKQQQHKAKKANVELFAQRTTLQERRQLKPTEQVVACPRCQSLNTKFCYYNNYSLTQPRHFCKNCRRYWTAGGTLRNVPVGGGCRKIKRSSSKSTYHHQQVTVDHRDAIYSPAAHGITAHGSILDSCHNMSHAAAIWQLQQQHHTPSFAASAAVTASLFHNVDKLAATAFDSDSQHAATTSTCAALQPIMHESTDRLEQVPAGLNIGHRHSQQPFESSIMNLGLFNSQQQQQLDVAANLRHLNPSQHAPLCNTGDDLSAVFIDSCSCCREFGVLSDAAGALSEGLCNFNQLPHGRSLDLAAADQDNTTRTTLMAFHNDINTRADSWRVLLQQMPKQEDNTTSPLQQWPVQEHTTLRQGSSLDLNSFKDHVKAELLQTETSSLSHPFTHGLGGEQEQEPEDGTQCVQQQPAAAGATAAAASATSWQHYLYSASHHHHHAGSGMPHYEVAAPSPPDTSIVSSNPTWSHLDLHTLCGSGGAMLL